MSNTTDQLGKQAKEVTEDLQKMGETVRDAAQAKLGQAGEKAAEYCGQAQDKAPRRRLRLRAIRPRATAAVRLDGGRHRLAARPLLERPLAGDDPMAPLDQFVKSVLDVGGDRRGRCRPLPGQGRAGPLDARRAAELPAQPGVRLARTAQAGPYPGRIAHGNPGLCGAGHRGLDGGGANDRPGPQNARVPRQPSSETPCGERLLHRQVEQGDKIRRGRWPESSPSPAGQGARRGRTSGPIRFACFPSR